MFPLRTMRRAICLAMLGGLVASALLVPPQATVTTPLRAPFGDEPAGLGPLLAADYESGRKVMYHLGLYAVDGADRLWMLDRRNDLWAEGRNGRLTKRCRLSWACEPRFLTRGADSQWWLVDMHGWRLVLFRADGTPVRALWSTMSAGPRARSGSMPAAVEQHQVLFDRAAATVTVPGGGIAVLDEPLHVRVFDRHGHQAAEYGAPLSGPPGFTFEGPYLSLAAHRDGALFGYGWGIRPGPGDDRKLAVVTWPSPARPVWREIDVAALGPVQPIDFILRCVADRDVLYFQYYLHDHREEPRPLWPGPTAIARCGPDGRARKVFDIKAHYREEQAQDKDWRCGDLIRVSPAGDLFLEIQTKSHYRVDKVSFQRWWQRRRSATRSE